MVWISVCLISFCNYASADISEKVQEYSIATKDVAYDVGSTYLSREHLEFLLLIEPVESSWVLEWQVPFLTRHKLFLMLQENCLKTSFIFFFKICLILACHSHVIEFQFMT